MITRDLDAILKDVQEKRKRKGVRDDALDTKLLADIEALVAEVKRMREIMCRAEPNLLEKWENR